MTGFVAIIANQPGRAIPESAGEGFANAYLRLRGGERQQIRGEGVCAWGFGTAGRTATVQEHEGSWVLCAGTVQHPGSLLDADLDMLEGQFALVRHDAGNGLTSVVSDPFGMFGLFAAERDGLTYVSTSALVLARHLRAAPSRIGLQTFLVAGYHCGARTNWETIERVAGGTEIRFGPQGPQRRTYWRPFVDHDVTRLDISASVDRCLKAAVDAVGAISERHETLWCDLTGGYDTRILVLLARAAGLSFATSTNGTEDNEDVRLARVIAATAGWDWSRVELPADWDALLPSRLAEAVAWADGALDALTLSGVLWGHEWKARLARGLLNGGGGEHYWSYAWQHEYGRSSGHGPTSVQRWVRFRMLRAIPTEVFTHDPRAEVMADLIARMRPVITPYLDEPRAVQADALYLHKCTGHFGAYASAALAHVDLMLPFYTRASFTAAFSTDPRHRFGHRFYRRLIERLDPQIAALPTAKGGPAQPPRVGNLHTFWPYYARLGEKGLNKVVQRTLGRPLRRTLDHPDQRAARARAAAVACVGTDLDDWRSCRLYERSKLSVLLADAGRPEFADSVLLGRILTTELTLRAADVALD